MAIKKNISAKHASSSMNRSPRAITTSIRSTTTSHKPKRLGLSARMDRYDLNLARIRLLFDWPVDGLQQDLLRSFSKNGEKNMEQAVCSVIALLEQSPKFKQMRESLQDHMQYADWGFNILCAQIYLAGRMSPTRIDPEEALSEP